jgi:dipeptidyl aminopeptidase/acylaminoacyl peptidase
MNAKRFGVPRSWMAAAAFLLAGTGAWAQPAAQIPAASFFDKPAVTSVSISPTGRHLALTALNKDGFHQLVVIDTATMQPAVAASFMQANIVNVHWVNDKRLVYGVQEDGDREVSDWIVGTGLYAIDRDGSDPRQLANVTWQGVGEHTTVNHHILGTNTRLLSTTWAKDSDFVFVTIPKFKLSTRELEAISLLKVDTRTGESTTYQRPGDTWSWGIDRENLPRIVMTKEPEGRFAIRYLERGGESWSKLVEFDWIGPGEGAFEPLGFGNDGTLYVSHRVGDGTSALYTYDLKEKKLSAQPVFSTRGFDIDAHLIVTRDGLVGIRYKADADGTYWIDPKMKELQARLDKLLPATVNSIGVPVRGEVPFVVVSASSDVEPAQYFLYDTLVRVGRSHPNIDSRLMSPRDLVRIKSRDGLEMPAWVTVPKDGKKGPRPTVVLVHGGPWVRGGSWQWSPDAQFLASRGYAVIEPEFRGSEGFGFKHFKAGWKQWGLSMQNDVADATRWAIEKGIADPKRICIAGASYGGYATLMGLVNDPDLYRCGFEWVGVTDIDLMFSITWSDMSPDVKQYGLAKLIGDPQKDAAQFKATSPIQLASKITQPLLLGYGAQDRRVPLKHGTDFRDAVTKTNQDVEWVVYPEEGHGWYKLKDNVDWWTRVEKFLARNIGTEQK